MGKRQSKVDKTLAEPSTLVKEKHLEKTTRTEMASNSLDLKVNEAEAVKLKEEAEPGIVTNTKEDKDGISYEVVIKAAPVPDKKPNIYSPVKEITKENVIQRLSAAEHRRRSFESEKLHKIAVKMQYAKQVPSIRDESVEQKARQVAEKLEEKMKTVESKQEVARIAFEKQRQAKQERFKDVLQSAHEKEEEMVKNTEEKLQVKTVVSTEKREAFLKGIKEHQQARFKKIEIAKSIRVESEISRCQDLEEKALQKFQTAKEILENQEKARQEKFEAEEERLRRAKTVTKEKMETEVMIVAEKLQQKMEMYKENKEAQRVARLEKLRAEELHREEVRLKKERNKASQG